MHVIYAVQFIHYIRDVLAKHSYRQQFRPDLYFRRFLWSFFLPNNKAEIDAQNNLVTHARAAVQSVLWHSSSSGVIVQQQLSLHVQEHQSTTL